MKRQFLVGMFLVLVLAASACAPTPTPPPTATAVPTTVAPAMTMAPAATTAPAMTMAPAATSAPAMTMAPAATNGPVKVTVMISNKSGISSPFLVDGQGRAVYLFENDTQNGGTSTCTGGCAQKWPPVTVSGAPVAGAGVDGSLLGTITLSDNSTQVTYNGWPLYYYAGDSAPSDTNGQGLNNVWYLVTAGGTAVQ